MILNSYGLKRHFALRAFLSLSVCVALFLVLYYLLALIGDGISQKSGFTQTRISAQAKSLQKYVDDNHVSSDNVELLRKWEKRQPILFFEVYKDSVCIYSSAYQYDEYSISVYFEEGSTYILQLKLEDGPVNVCLLSDFTYQFYLFGTVLAVVISLALFIALIIIGNRKLIRYVCRLNDEVQILEGGNLEYKVSVEGNDELTDLARSMNQMRTSMLNRMEEERLLEESNKRLVTEMSHDLRTPLTGMLLYLEILRTHRYSSEEELQDYLLKIEEKAHHLKMISDNLFEYSTQKTMPKTCVPMLMERAFRKSLEGFVSDLESRGFSVSSAVDWEECFVVSEDDYVLRILENISSNIAKYAEPGSEVHIESIVSGGHCGFSIMNVCARNVLDVESHGIGIESICSMMEKMKGKCSIERTDEMFEMTLLFTVV